MKIRLDKENINTKDYFEKTYSDPHWRNGWDGADLRLSQAMELISTEFPRHLDIGCADGTFTKYYLAKFPNTEGHGVDISEVVIEIAKKNCPQGHFQPADCYYLPFEDNYFDLVHSAEMVEHLEFPEKALAEMYRVLKPQGTLIITVPNEKADDYIEHLWKWDIYGVRQMLETNMSKDKLSSFHIVEEYPSFHNGHIMYIAAEKR